MNKAVVLGWILSGVGTALWLYGYFEPGFPPIINWTVISPWLAPWLPNLQAEIGMAMSLGALIPIYWPSPKRS
jgi:hypothetical protein